MAARTNDMKATCRVERLRVISGAYPRDSRSWSAEVTSPLPLWASRLLLVVMPILASWSPPCWRAPWSWGTTPAMMDGACRQM